MTNNGRQPRGLAVLISGFGSNLQAIIDAIAAGELAARVNCVISDRPEARGLLRARRAGVPSRVVRPADYGDRAAFDAALARVIDAYDVDLIVLAGFMRILGADFISRYEGRIINIHPSLLPKYPGLDTHRRALENADTNHGASVHFVSGELDAGPVIIRESLQIDKHDTEDTLRERVHRLEHRILPRAIDWYLQGRLTVSGGEVLLDGGRQPDQGL